MIKKESAIEFRKDVRIRVKGTKVNAENEVIETSADGSLIYKAPYFYVSYEEKLDKESKNSSKTVLRYSKDELRVTRKGEVTCALEYAKDKTHRSIYITPYGEFEMELVTDSIEIKMDQDGAQFFVDYQIGMNTMPLEKEKLEIEIRYL